MDEEFYKLIPEEGKHLANSRKTEGANRGVYLDDKTNKPNGAGEFIKVDPAELTSDDIVKNAFRYLAGVAIGIAVTKAAPHVKEWAKEQYKKHTEKQKLESQPLILTKATPPDQSNINSVINVEDAYYEYRENMSSEEAQRELIEALILYIESIRKVERVANANVIDSEGNIVDGRKLLNKLFEAGVFSSALKILHDNPKLLSNSQILLLHESIYDALSYKLESV